MQIPHNTKHDNTYTYDAAQNRELCVTYTHNISDILSAITYLSYMAFTVELITDKYMVVLLYLVCSLLGDLVKYDLDQ